MSHTPALPPTPEKRKLRELPLDSDIKLDAARTDVAVLPPLDPKYAGQLMTFENSDFTGLTPAEIFDMNQKLLNDSVPVRPLIDSLAPMSSLRSEYENGSSAFLKQIDWLVAHGYDSVRRTRGDGDCFYRSLSFAYIESLIKTPDLELAVASSLSALSGTKATLDDGGIQEIVYGDFYDEFTGLIESIVKPDLYGITLNLDGLLVAFQKPEVSNSIVMYLRLLTSVQIRRNPAEYEAFITHPDTKEPMDVQSFCANVVEVMGKEADNVEIQALCRALKLNVDLAYLNGSGEDGVTDFITFRDDSDPKATPLTLLYRPGHYDILVSKKS